MSIRNLLKPTDKATPAEREERLAKFPPRVWITGDTYIDRDEIEYCSVAELAPGGTAVRLATSKGIGYTITNGDEWLRRNRIGQDHRNEIDAEWGVENSRAAGLLPTGRDQS